MEGNLKKVYVLVGKGMTIENVREEIKQEGYNFAFHFEGDFEAFKDADEVWTFGDCKSSERLELAKDMGKDIWVMG